MKLQCKITIKLLNWKVLSFSFVSKLSKFCVLKKDELSHYKYFLVTGKKDHASLRDKIKLCVSKLNILRIKELNVSEREKKGNV